MTRLNVERPRCPECGERFSVVVPVTLADATITDTCGHRVRVEVRDDEPGVWRVSSPDTEATR